MENRKETVGKIASELLTKAPEKATVIEMQQAMQEEYMKNLLEAVDRGYKKYPNDFYIEVITKNEKLMQNVFRNYFSPRLSCPTPNYDQTVFRYNRQVGQIEYIWTIPSRDASHHLKDNMLIVAPGERELLKYVLQFSDGTLYKLSKKLNGEKLETPELEKKDLSFSVT